MIRILLLLGAALAAYGLQQSHTLAPLLSLLALLSLWVASEIRLMYRQLPATEPDEQPYHLDV
ncbi:hypothetical protein [Aeromonas dhakensis]|uniref:hypothetical protein n=1 Tax=Aeromonas dhakensis TaxID=196024 RepID=UPI0023794EAA|nr:hypothetical protein [Aeromonas dhakensis]MDD9210881.1 hypothetical protein [Aeromonas dhakensis]